MIIKRKRYSNEYGFIDYHYSIEKEYPNGLLLFMGSYIETEHRNKGIFKQMIMTLFSMFPNKTEVQLAISNKNLLSFFKRLNFTETSSIEYWGCPENTINLKGYINN